MNCPGPVTTLPSFVLLFYSDSYFLSEYKIPFGVFQKEHMNRCPKTASPFSCPSLTPSGPEFRLWK